VKFLTLWALSVDNLKKREEDEVKAIIKLVNSIEKYLEKIKIDNLRFETI
jgi:undecaprenyl pyrophosphate synthase